MDEPKPIRPNEPLSQATLQQLLEQHERDKAAMRQEFEASNSPEGANTPLTEENAKSRIVASAPDALQALQYLVKHAESESVRANCAKYIMDITLGKKKIEKTDEDKIEELINSLRPKATAE